MSDGDVKVKIILGSVEPKTFYAEEGDWTICYGYSIHRDINGVITKKTEPFEISRMTRFTHPEPVNLLSRLLKWIKK